MFLNLKLILPRDNEISVFVVFRLLAYFFYNRLRKVYKKPSQAEFYAAGSESGVLLRKGWFHSLL